MSNLNIKTMKKVIISMAILFFNGLANQAQALTNNEAEMYNSLESACLEEAVGGAYLTFADKFGGEINRDELNSTTEIGVAGCAAGSKIYAFGLLVKKNGTTTKFVGKTYKLSKEILQTGLPFSPLIIFSQF